MGSIDDILARLGTPNVVSPVDFETSLKALRDDLVSRFPAIASVVDLESEPSQILLQVVAYREMLLRAHVNDAARQSNSYLFATGSSLDYHAAFYDLERLTGESDRALRERIRLAIVGGYSGTAERYKLVALSASPDVENAIVWRDDPNPVVKVAVRSTAIGGVATPTLLALVVAALDDPRVKMVNDTIEVVSSTTTTVNVVADVWLLPSSATSIITDLQNSLAETWDAQSEIGSDLTVSWLTSRLMHPGVQKVEVTSPAADIVVAPHEGVAIGTVTLNFIGRQN